MLISMALFAFLTLETHAQSPTTGKQMFAFKFPTNQPLIYAVSIRSRTSTDNKIGDKTTVQSNTQEIHYNARLTVHKENPDGTTSVYFKPYNFEEVVDNVGVSHVVTEIHDLQIKSQQNGVVTIDTENKVGMRQANSVKIGVYPDLLSGYFEFDPAGKIVKCQGDIPFIDYWTGVLKERRSFFSIYFPNHPVGINESWAEVYLMNSGGGVMLDKPLTITNTFTRGTDLMTNGNSMATFVITGAERQQNINGSIEQTGQRTSMNIPLYDHKISGTFHFDQKRGILLDADTTQISEVSVNMLVQGNTATSHNTVETGLRINLIAEPLGQSQKRP